MSSVEISSDSFDTVEGELEERRTLFCRNKIRETADTVKLCVECCCCYGVLSSFRMKWFAKKSYIGGTFSSAFKKEEKLYYDGWLPIALKIALLKIDSKAGLLTFCNFMLRVWFLIAAILFNFLLRLR